MIIVRFTGEGLRPISDSGAAVAYQKYPLPARPAHSEPAASSEVEEPPSSDAPRLSDEALKEERALRVAHTLFGSEASVAGREKRMSAPPKPPRLRRPTEDPVSVPTTGMAPQVVGAIVVFSLLLLAAMGVVLLR